MSNKKKFKYNFKVKESFTPKKENIHLFIRCLNKNIEILRPYKIVNLEEFQKGLFIITSNWIIVKDERIFE